MLGAGRHPTTSLPLGLHPAHLIAGMRPSPPLMPPLGVVRGEAAAAAAAASVRTSSSGSSGGAWGGVA